MALNKRWENTFKTLLHEAVWRVPLQALRQRHCVRPIGSLQLVTLVWTGNVENELCVRKIE